MCKGDGRLLDIFLQKCLKNNEIWPMKVTNENVREIAGMEKTCTFIRIRRWK
jgi:hypothetical protein